MSTFRSWLSVFLAAAGLCQWRSPSVHAQSNLEAYFTVRIGSYIRGVTLADDGSLYVLFRQGGAFDRGTLTRVAADGSATVLHAFDGQDGALPAAPMRFGRDGALYGTTPYGGKDNRGTFYRLTQSGQLSVLHDFNAEEGGSISVALFSEADGGWLATTDAGQLVRLSPDGTQTLLYTGLQSPSGGLIRASNGIVYGLMLHWNNDNRLSGGVYRLSPEGEVSIGVRSHSELPEPRGELIESSDGYLFGVVVGPDYKAYEILPITRNSYSGFKLAPILLDP